MNKYKITAHIINPFDDEQKRLLGENYQEVVKDYCMVDCEKMPLEERKEIIKKYPIDGVVEDWRMEVDYFIDEDADGLYLLEKVS